MKVKNYYKIYYKMAGVKIDSLNTQILDCSFSWLGTGTSIKKYGDNDDIVTHGQSREFRMYMKNAAQTEVAVSVSMTEK
jgi:hypothetical protein